MKFWRTLSGTHGSVTKINFHLLTVKIGFNNSATVQLTKSVAVNNFQLFIREEFLPSPVKNRVETIR